MLLLIPLLLAQAPAASSNATTLVLSPPRTLVELDRGKLKGDPWQLAWSPDGKELYLQTIERDKKTGAPIGMHHFSIPVSAAKVSGADNQPAWAVDYWRWKSNQSPPGMPNDRIAVDHRTETIRTTAAPMGGALATGGTDASRGTTIGDAANAAITSQSASIYTLRWHGELLGEWTNTAVVPGLTFGWAPADRQALAYSDKDGRLVVVPARGAKQIVPETHETMLPAWSNDGQQIAYLEKIDKNKYALKLVGVAR